jgi:hypothetical protein
MATGPARLRASVLAISLLVAGGLHLALTGDHMEESLVLGWGFVVAGAAQIVLGVMAIRPGRAPYRAIVGLNVALIALYLMHLTTGLPLPDAREATDEMRGLLGTREAIEPLALVTKAAELIGIGVALAARRDRAVVELPEQLKRAA